MIALSTEQGFPYWLAIGTICGAGRWPSRDRERKGLRRYARAWPPIGPQGQSWGGHISCPAGRGVWESGTGRGRAYRAGRGAGSGGQNWGAFLRGGAVSAERRAHASVSQVSKSQVDKSKKLKHVFSKPSKSPASSRRSRWNCARRRALRGYGSNKASSTKPTHCYPRSTTGSPKALTRRTCKRRRRCWKSLGHKIRAIRRCPCRRSSLIKRSLLRSPVSITKRRKLNA